MSLLLMIMRLAFAERMIGAAKAAARRGVLAGLLAATAMIAAFFAVSLATVAGVIALSDHLPPALAACVIAVGFLAIAGVTAAFARRALQRVTQPGPPPAPTETKPAIALNPQTIEVLVACGVAVILGVMAGRANRAAPKPPE